jgi:hypothetical protein
MCWNCLWNAPTLRKTFETIRRLTAEPRFVEGVRPLDMADELGFSTVSRLTSLLKVLDARPGPLTEQDELNLCDIGGKILEHSQRGLLHRRARRILDRRDEKIKISLAEVRDLHRDLVDTVTNTIERRVAELRLLLQKCPEKSGLRLTITERRYRIVPAEPSMPFDVSRLLPLYWWMSRPAWQNRIGCWEKQSLKTVHHLVRLAIKTGLLRHDDGSWAGEIPRLDTIQEPGVRAALSRLLEESEMFSRIVDLFYEPRYDDLVMRYRAREHGKRVATFLSVSRNHVVEIVNNLLAGWAEPLQLVEYLGMFPHETELTPVPKPTLEELVREFEALFQLGLDLWFDEEEERRRFEPPRIEPGARFDCELGVPVDDADTDTTRPSPVDEPPPPPRRPPARPGRPSPSAPRRQPGSRRRQRGPNDDPTDDASPQR